MSYQASPEGIKLLEKHEGRRNRPYRDSEGYLTVGVGHNLDAVPLSDRVIDLIRDEDIDAIAHQVSGVVGDVAFAALDPVRQWALIDMGFMGPEKLALFKKLLAAVRSGNWQAAHDEALNSKWAAQVGSRAVDVASMLKTGEWP